MFPVQLIVPWQLKKFSAQEGVNVKKSIAREVQTPAKVSRPRQAPEPNEIPLNLGKSRRYRKMPSTIINVPNVFIGYCNAPEAVTGIQNIPASSEYFSQSVRANKMPQKVAKHRTYVYKTIGVEKALQHSGSSKNAKYHVIRSVFEFQDRIRSGY